MDILVINGSPKGENSNTLKLTNAFISGINKNKNNFIETITVAEKNIEPLCAWYSSEAWGGDAAFENPLFILTNKIICIGWGSIYLLSSFWTWSIMHGEYFRFSGLINMVCPAVMGILTAVISKKFPAYYARKKMG
jgi:hypothetical protein